MNRYAILGVLLAILTSFAVFRYSYNKLEAGKPTNIQVALILDTSNSMDGLIEQAKSQLWKLVNELADMKKGKKTANLEISLYQFGNDGLRVTQGFVEQITPLTQDLDALSASLFDLTTKGGSEYCGWAIKDALEDLNWSDSKYDLKLIFIAGNEPFNQGSVDFREACKQAKKQGVIVNTIHCGDYFQGKNDFWEEGALLTGGVYMNIDQDDKVVHIPTPYDDKIMELNQQLNTTYIGYGKKGIQKLANQQIQDSNAANYGVANSRTRALVKSKKAYKNTSWDLVDYAAENKIEEIEEEALPDELKPLTTNQRVEFIEKKRQSRIAIKRQLREYDKKVKAYIAEKQKEAADGQTLDNVMLEAIKNQAKEKGFKNE